ncbi:MAG: peptidase, partial [Gemmatimonadota bacterium]|nr:peptidase [Gemmatimonadota bacterium]
MRTSPAILLMTAIVSAGCTRGSGEDRPDTSALAAGGGQVPAGGDTAEPAAPVPSAGAPAGGG